MPLDPPFTDWADPPLYAAFTGSIRLTASQAGISVYCAAAEPVPETVARSQHYKNQATLTPIAISGSQQAAIVIPQLLLSVPAFDIVALEDGTFVVAIEAFGGATNALLVGVASKGELTVSTAYRDFSDYRFPRFVRGDVTPGKLSTAIVNDGALVAMSGKPLAPADIGTKSPPYTKLADANSGVAIATSPPNGSLQAVALFAKTGDDGPPLPSGDFLGTLTLTALTGGRPTGKPIVLFDPGATYAFDVDVQSGLALVLASTSGGPRLLSCDLASGKTAPIAWPPGYPAGGTWIASPSVLAVPGDPGSRSFSIAFFEAVGGDVKGIRYAQLNLATSP